MRVHGEAPPCAAGARHSGGSVTCGDARAGRGLRRGAVTRPDACGGGGAFGRFRTRALEYSYTRTCERSNVRVSPSGEARPRSRVCAGAGPPARAAPRAGRLRGAVARAGAPRGRAASPLPPAGADASGRWAGRRAAGAVRPPSPLRTGGATPARLRRGPPRGSHRSETTGRFRSGATCTPTARTRGSGATRARRTPTRHGLLKRRAASLHVSKDMGRGLCTQGADSSRKGHARARALGRSGVAKPQHVGVPEWPFSQRNTLDTQEGAGPTGPAPSEYLLG